jgi:N-acetyl-anhydromuramyl-L-alanine amidase AmpD
VALREWEYIVLHHTATSEGDVAVIDREHQKRKDSSGAPWRGIGYHFLIGNGKGMKDGAIEPTFRWTEQADGAHAGSLRHNERGIGICLVGNFNKTAPTKKQLASLKKLTQWLQQEIGIPDARVLKHSEIKVTDCPGKRFKGP